MPIKGHSRNSYRNLKRICLPYLLQAPQVIQELPFALPYNNHINAQANLIYVIVYPRIVVAIRAAQVRPDNSVGQARPVRYDTGLFRPVQVSMGGLALNCCLLDELSPARKPVQPTRHGPIDPARSGRSITFLSFFLLLF